MVIVNGGELKCEKKISILYFTIKSDSQINSDFWMWDTKWWVTLFIRFNIIAWCVYKYLLSICLLYFHDDREVHLLTHLLNSLPHKIWCTKFQALRKAFFILKLNRNIFISTLQSLVNIWPLQLFILSYSLASRSSLHHQEACYFVL